MNRICDVCRLLDLDGTLKPCGYCNVCDSYICLPDSNNWIRRLKAALIRKTEQGYKGHPSYEDIVKRG